MSKSKTWPELGTIRKNKNNKSYIVFGQNVKILVGKYNKETKGYDDYQELDLGEYRTAQLADPRVGLDALLDGQHITETEHSARLSRLDENQVRYKIVVPPSEE